MSDIYQEYAWQAYAREKGPNILMEILFLKGILHVSHGGVCDMTTCFFVIVVWFWGLPMAGKGPDINYDSIPHIVVNLCGRKSSKVKFVMLVRALKLLFSFKLILILCLVTENICFRKKTIDFLKNISFTQVKYDSLQKHPICSWNPLAFLKSNHLT